MEKKTKEKLVNIRNNFCVGNRHNISEISEERNCKVLKKGKRYFISKKYIPYKILKNLFDVSIFSNIF